MSMQWRGGISFAGLEKRIERACEAAVMGVADDVFDESQQLVPDDPETSGGGDLKRSGAVTAQHTGREAVAAISYGTDHAIYQHEDLTFEHDNGQSGKFLERPLSGAQRAAGAKAAARIRRALS